MNQPELIGNTRKGVNLVISDNYFKKVSSVLKNCYSFKLTHCCIFAELLDESFDVRFKVTELGVNPLIWMPLLIDNKPAEESTYLEINPLSSLGHFYVFFR